MHIHSLPSFNFYRTLHSHTNGINHLAFSANSNFLASASDDRTIRIWEVEGSSGGEKKRDDNAEEGSVRILRGHLSGVMCIAWNPRGDLIASGGMDEMVRVWDVRKGERAFLSLSLSARRANSRLFSQANA